MIDSNFDPLAEPKIKSETLATKCLQCGQVRTDTTRWMELPNGKTVALPGYSICGCNDRRRRQVKE